jgi:hypothetical protein
MSDILPTRGGIKAPPDTAMIINPEISLERLGYLFTVITKIRGNMLEAANPIKNISVKAKTDDGEGGLDI